MIHGRPVLARDDADTRDEGLERLAVFGAVGGGERGEQPAVERARERDDLRLAGPLADKLERRLVGLGARVAEERAIGERARHQLLREPFTRLRAVQVRDVDQAGCERPLDRSADDRVIVAERVHADAGDEIEVVRPVVGDELRAVARHEHRAGAGIHLE